jgi:ABC-type sugar transport system ATPase subunit
MQSVTTGSLLQLHGISKAYPGVQALARVDIDANPGEVQAQLREHGAGKSTLMKIVAGSVRPDEGELFLDGEPLPTGSPAAVRQRGIGAVYQDLSLIPTMSVGENVLLGRWRRHRGLINLRRTELYARPILERVGLDVPPTMPVRELGVAGRQLVEIAKALSARVRVMLLDEPTSALSDPESRSLFRVIRDLVAGGVAVIYVSHRLPEILEIADRITVLRDGTRVGEIAAPAATELQLARMMVGHDVGEVATSNRASTDAVGDGYALVARGLGRPPRLKPVDLTVRAGEIVTVFGLVGAGRTRLARTLFGIEPSTTGELELFGQRAHIRRPADAIAAGVGFVGADRAAGLVPTMTVRENITLASMNRTGRGPLLGMEAERALAERYVKELNIRTPSLQRRVITLSGGNQQKVLLARWLCAGARLLILDDPVRGVDVGAKEEVYRLVRDLAADGVAILYLTSEIREARRLGSRVIVMADGGIVDELSPTDPEDRIMTAAGGVDV